MNSWKMKLWISTLTFWKPNMDTYDFLDELYEQYPTRGKMVASKDTEVNTRMSHLKRCEDKLNRYRKQGIL